MNSNLKIATPVSTIFHATAHLAEILDLSDVLEWRELSRPVASSLQRIYHCDWSLISPWSDRELQEITNIIINNKPDLVTFHLHACYVNPPLENGMFMPIGKPMTREEMFGHARTNLQNLKEKLGKSLPWAVENNNFYPTGAYTEVTDGGFITELTNELGLNILLDLAHAQITAVNQNITLEEYLGFLDLEKVVQLHLSRPGRDAKDPNLAKDFHEVLEDDDWVLVKSIMPRCVNLQYVTIEYYKNDANLITMLKKLREVITK